MKSKVLLWSVVAALGGLLFGLDTAVISGAEQAFQKLWHLDTVTHGLAVAMALWGTVFGSALGGIPSDRLGRKPTLFIIGILFVVSSLGAALAPNVNVFIVFRFLGGLAIGSSSVTAPVYISEIAPAKYRGRLVAMFQFNIVFGILLAYLANYAIMAMGGESAWRLMLGWITAPSLAFMLAVLFVPESPRWLIVKKNDIDKARGILESIDADTAEEQLNNIRNNAQQTALEVKEPFFSRKHFHPIMLAFLFALFNQMSGINAVIYYSPRIFELAGQKASTALLSSTGIGLVNLIFTLVGISLIDRYGRKLLMYIGSFGYLISLSLIAYAFLTASFAGITLYLFLFIAAHAIGQGAVIWVFISEIFPTQIRGAGQAFGSFTHWIFAAIIANVFPYFATTFGPGPVFVFFGVFMIFQLLFVQFLMPETKGKSLEELGSSMSGSGEVVKPLIH
jgi:sugar porter (SP) family MFS transporter